jgi:hypothetical protein
MGCIEYNNATPKSSSELKKTWTDTSVDRAEGLTFHDHRDRDQTLGEETAEQDGGMTDREYTWLDIQ